LPPILEKPAHQPVLALRFSHLEPVAQ
jgi:hypothetical protein